MCERGLFWVKRAEGLVSVEDWSKKFGSERLGVVELVLGYWNKRRNDKLE